MNIQNISVLAEQLEMLGFQKLGYSLLKRISFKPNSFFLTHRLEKGNDRLSFQIHFEKDKKRNCYVLIFHDAVLQKGIVLTDTSINGISIISLERQMASIDWKKAFELTEQKPWNADDKSSWEKEERIEEIIENLIALDSTEEGKAMAMNLKLKYWADIPFHELVGNISPLKNKSEVSQRFYFFEGEPGISVEEAYRFLQNKWIEKQMQIKRKQDAEADTGENNAGDQDSTGSGLLKKKRIPKGNGLKNKK